MAIDYSRLSRIVDGKQEKPAKVTPKKPAKVAPKKVKDSARQEPINDSKKAEKKKIQDSLKKNASARKYKAFKVTDSYKNYKKFIKDALEDTESTDEAVAVGISALDSVPADEAIAAVIEVLGEAIDILQEQCPECAEGEGEPAEVAEPEELDEDADEEEIEDSVSVSVTNGAGETVTVDSEDGNSAVASDVAPVSAPVDDFGAEPMGEELPEESMGEELPEEGIGDSKRGKKAAKKRIKDACDETKAAEILTSGEFSYECFEGELTITSDDGCSFTLDLTKLSPAMIKLLMHGKSASESKGIKDSKKRIKDESDNIKEWASWVKKKLESGEMKGGRLRHLPEGVPAEKLPEVLKSVGVKAKYSDGDVYVKLGDSKIKDGMSNEEVDALDAAQGDIFAEIEALIKAGKTQEALDALAANKQTLEALGK